jgi:6,7-dimethyl-8-ribityllumazine synthase
MKTADNTDEVELIGRNLRIGIAQARFNRSLTDRLAQACKDELRAVGVEERHVRHVMVPGALELPIALARLAETDEFDALIALGCVIRGETYHFELVADQSGAGVMHVALEYTIPIANAILAVENEAQAWARVEEKGRSAARVAVEMANLMEDLE